MYIYFCIVMLNIIRALVVTLSEYHAAFWFSYRKQFKYYYNGEDRFELSLDIITPSDSTSYVVHVK